MLNLLREELVGLASRNKTKQAIINVLARRGHISGRNPIGMLCGALQVEGVQGKDLVISIVEELKRDNKVIVKSSKGKITSIAFVRPRGHVDRTEMSPQAKREHTFAKGIPAHLPNDWCTPVVVRQRSSEDAGNPEVMTNDTFVYVKGSPYHKTLTMLMGALRHHADESGVCDTRTASSVLHDVVGMTTTTVRRAETYLKLLNLYVVVPGEKPFQSNGYIVDVECDEVTIDMVQEVRRSINEKYPRSKPKPAEVESTNDTSVQGVDEPIELQLASIIEDLDAEIASLGETILAIDAKLEHVNNELQASNVEREKLTKKNAGLQAKIAELEERLSARPTINDPRIAEIMKRHTSK